MKEMKGNIFEIPADAICVTTNGIVKANGELVMGAGIAKAFKEKWPGIPRIAGKTVNELDNHVHHLGDATIIRDSLKGSEKVGIVTFPTKEDWKDPSPIWLIERSAKELVDLINQKKWKVVLLTRPGCGNGGLGWETQVKPAIKDILDDRFIIVTL